MSFTCFFLFSSVARWFHSITFDDTNIHAMSSPSHAQGVCAESLETWMKWGQWHRSEFVIIEVCRIIIKYYICDIFTCICIYRYIQIPMCIHIYIYKYKCMYRCIIYIYIHMITYVCVRDHRTPKHQSDTWWHTQIPTKSIQFHTHWSKSTANLIDDIIFYWLVGYMGGCLIWFMGSPPHSDP